MEDIICGVLLSIISILDRLSPIVNFVSENNVIFIPLGIIFGSIIGLKMSLEKKRGYE